MISDDKFQEIIDKTDMVSLVSEYVELTKKGSGYFGLCPFHDDSSPSFSVSPDKKIAKCMSCGEGGNPITFLKKIKKISTAEAIDILAKKAGVEVDLNVAPKKEDKNKKYYDIYKVAQEFYTYNLFNSKSGKKALEYLYKRGLTEETIKTFGVGLAPSEKDTLTNVLIDNNFLDIDCIEIGLIKNNGTTLYDVFTNRIMFPITNENGQTIAFSGRIYDDSNTAKYVNTMETIIYRKGDHLYNLSNAISQINKTKRIILCEGQMDVIKVSNANLKDVVCALGSALTTNQVKLIKKYATNVILAYDNDAAGIKATKTAINLLKGLNVDILQLPVGVDPDEFISKNSNEKFIELLDNKINSIEFVYNSYFTGKNIYSLVDAEVIKNDVFKFINTQTSNTIKEQLFNKLTNDLKINYDILLKDYNQFSGVKQKVVPKYVEPSVYTRKQPQHINDYNNAPPANYDFGLAPPPIDYGAPPSFEDFNDYVPTNNNVHNHFNKNTNQINVVNVDVKDENRGMIDACKNVIALAIYDKEHYTRIFELIDAEVIELYLPNPYDEIFSHLAYIYRISEYPSKTAIYTQFVKDYFTQKTEFNSIIEIANSYDSKTNFRKLLEDGIKSIKSVRIQDDISSSKAITVDDLNDQLKDRRELNRMNIENMKNKK